MNLADQPYFSVLRQRLDQLGTRQRLVAENLANVSTPGFTPRDTDDKAFLSALESAHKGGAGAMAPARTHAGHLGGGAHGPIAVRTVERPDSETTLDGNQVVLEDQLLRAGETRAAMETSLALYQKGLALMRLAARAPR